MYATSSQFSWTDGQQFMQFCKAAGIPCERLPVERYFKNGMCDGAFKTREYTYDAMLLKEYYLEQLKQYGSAVEIKYETDIVSIQRDKEKYLIHTKSESFETGFILNASYAATNQILSMAGLEPFKIKYELCEIILCDVNEALRHVGITVMDGPFFSIMPFGKTGLHSLTSVTFTPHSTSYQETPVFSCQEKCGQHCSPKRLGNCNFCVAKPETAFPYMANLARKYMLDTYEFTYKQSLFSMKPILMSSEIDDSRPTVIRKYGDGPIFVAVLSGKINTVYDLDEVLCDE